MKKPPLIASGIILLGIIFLTTGIYLITAKNSEVTSSVSITPTPEVIFTPYQNTASKTPKVSIKKSPIPTPVPVSTPEPPNPTKVEWASKESFYGSERWRVFLSSTKWFDTGIPFITNDTLNIEKNYSRTVLFKINGREFIIKGDRQIYFFDRDGYSPNIRDTVKIKLVDGDEPASFELVLTHVNAICTDYPNHTAIHDASKVWADKIIAKTK